MPRTKKRIGKSGMVIFYDVTENFTHRMSLASGIILRNDGTDNFWYRKNPNGCECSWYGTPPKEWDHNQVIQENFSRTYESEKDYS